MTTITIATTKIVTGNTHDNNDNNDNDDNDHNFYNNHQILFNFMSNT